MYPGSALQFGGGLWELVGQSLVQSRPNSCLDGAKTLRIANGIRDEEMNFGSHLHLVSTISSVPKASLKNQAHSNKGRNSGWWMALLCL